MRLLLIIVISLGGGTAGAQVGPEDPIRFLNWAVSDVTAAAGGLATPDVALVAGGAVGTILLLAQFDERITRDAITLARKSPGRVRRIFHEAGNVKVVRPMAAVFFLGSLTSGRARLQDAAFTSLEAIVLSNLVTNALKFAVGRARPDEDMGAHRIRPFSAHRSFPSGHATTVFAFTTPWVLYYPHMGTYALFMLGAGTAFVRMIDHHHWFTDVLAGAAIGAGTGYLLSRRHHRLTSRIRLSPIAAGGSIGMHVRIVL